MEADEFPYDKLRIVLVSPRNPLNIGAAARAMSNMGFRRLRLVNAYHIAYREARSAVGAASILHRAKLYSSLADAVADCSLVVGTTSVANRELEHPLRRLEYGGRALRKHLLKRPAALVFGSERHGLTNEDLTHCHWLLRIPARTGHGSVNLGQAVAVCLYELIRSSSAANAKPASSQAAAAGDLERITQLLVDLLDLSGYIKPRAASATVRKTRLLVRRMNLSDRDAEIWLGMLRQLQWKLDN